MADARTYWRRVWAKAFPYRKRDWLQATVAAILGFLFLGLAFGREQAMDQIGETLTLAAASATVFLLISLKRAVFNVHEEDFAFIESIEVDRDKWQQHAADTRKNVAIANALLPKLTFAIGREWWIRLGRVRKSQHRRSPVERALVKPCRRPSSREGTVSSGFSRISTGDGHVSGVRGMCAPTITAKVGPVGAHPLSRGTTRTLAGSVLE